MDYYWVIRSFGELLGEGGVWRLPSYLDEVFVVDDSRLRIIEGAVKAVQNSSNVLLVGEPGTGKTALMFMVAKRLSEVGYKIGILRDVGDFISNEHLGEGVVLFFDDLPRASEATLRAIFSKGVRGVVATARSEELYRVKRVAGGFLGDTVVFDVGGLSPEKLREMLFAYSEREGVRFESERAVELVIQKAGGLPIYVWQVIREANILNLSVSEDFAGKIPQGMFDYVDDILWRVLDNHRDRYPILLLLLIMTDLKRYAINQDLYNYLFTVCKEEIEERESSVKEALFSNILPIITKYLAREGKTYTFRLPHDSWADVLRGKSNGPMSAEISLINTHYSSREYRRVLLEKAVIRAWTETVNKVDDMRRKQAFLENVRENLGEEYVKRLLMGEPVEQQVGLKKLESRVSVDMERGEREELLVAGKGSEEFAGIFRERRVIGLDEAVELLGNEEEALKMLKAFGEESPTEKNLYYFKGTIEKVKSFLVNQSKTGINPRKILGTLLNEYNLTGSDALYFINEYLDNPQFKQFKGAVLDAVVKESTLLKKLGLTRDEFRRLLFLANVVHVENWIISINAIKTGALFVSNLREGSIGLGSSSIQEAIEDVIRGLSIGQSLGMTKDLVKAMKDSGVYVSKIYELPVAKGDITALRYNEDNGFLYIGDRKGYIHIFDPLTMEIVRQARKHNGEVRGIAFSPDNSLVATIGMDKVFQVMDIETLATQKIDKIGKPGRSVDWNQHDIIALAIGDQILIVNAEEDYRLQNALTNPSKKTPVISVKWSRTGKYLATLDFNGNITIWDEKFTPWNPRINTKISKAGVNRAYTEIDWHPKEEKLVVPADKKIQIVNAENKTLEEAYTRMEKELPQQTPKWSKTGKLIASLGAYYINIWRKDLPRIPARIMRKNAKKLEWGPKLEILFHDRGKAIVADRVTLH